jgi:hypothetical protein
VRRRSGSQGPDHAEHGGEAEEGDRHGEQDDHPLGVALVLAHLVAELDDAAADLLVELAQVLVDRGLGADVDDDLGGRGWSGGLGDELLEAE